MSEFVLIPMMDEMGNELNEEDAIARYLIGDSSPIAEFNSTQEVEQSGFKSFEGAWPWAIQAGEALDEATNPIPSAEAVRADPHSPVAQETIDNPLKAAAQPYIDGLKKLGFYGTIFDPNSSGQTLQIDPDIAATGLDAADAALTMGAGLGIGMLRNAGRRSLTSTALDSLPDEGVFRRGHVENLLKAAKKQGAKDVDMQLMEQVLKDIEGDKISMPDFKRTAESKLIPLDMEVSDEWANYGIGNIGREIPVKDVPQRFREPSAFDTTETHLYKTPFEHSGAGKHFGSDASFKDRSGRRIAQEPEKTIGHVRMFKEQGDNGQIRYLAEVQSDAVQSNPYSAALPVEEIVKLEEEGMQLSSKLSKLIEIDKVNKSLDDKYFTQNGFETSKYLNDPQYKEMVKEISQLYSEVFNIELTQFDLDRPRPMEWLLRTEERINDRLNKIRDLIDGGKEAPSGFEQFNPYIFQRMIREENARAVDDLDNVVRIATPSTQATIEGWSLDPKYNGPKKRQRILNEFVKKEYGAREVVDDQGFTWYEWEPVESDYIKAFSVGGASVGAATQMPIEDDKSK